MQDSQLFLEPHGIKLEDPIPAMYMYIYINKMVLYIYTQLLICLYMLNVIYYILHIIYTLYIIIIQVAKNS